MFYSEILSTTNFMVLATGGILGLPTILSEELHWNFEVNLDIFILLRAQLYKISVFKNQ
jgi:hypothetical protein